MAPKCPLFVISEISGISEICELRERTSERGGINEINEDADNLFRIIRDNWPRASRAIGAPLSILKTPVARGFRLNRNVGGVLPGFGPVGKNFLWRSN